MTKSTGWTPERRERQRAAITRWKPWKHSTGPKTANGKARSSRNAERGQRREKIRAELRYFRQMIKDIDEERRDGI